MPVDRLKTRTKRGSGLIESVTVAVILIPIALCLLDLMVLVAANAINDMAAKNAARAAANQSNGLAALAAAQKSLQSFTSSPIVKEISLEMFDYPADKTAVTCQTSMLVRLPVPFPGLSELTFKAKDVEPIMMR